MKEYVENMKAQHPYLWRKLDILCHGIRDDTEGRLIEELYFKQNPKLTPRTGNNGLQIKMKTDCSKVIPLNVAVRKTFCRKSPYVIRRAVSGNTNDFLLYNEIDKSITSIVCPEYAPLWYQTALTRNETEQLIVGDLIVLEGDFTAIASVTDGCSYFNKKQACKFCALGSGQLGHAQYNSYLMKAFPYVVNDKAIQNFHLTGGNDYSHTRGLQQYITIVKQIKKHRINAKIAVECTPPKPEYQKEIFEQLKEAGADSITMNIEFWNDEDRLKYMPYKGAIPRDDYLHAFRVGIETFGRDKVTCGFIVGIEDLQFTKEGIRTVTKDKVVAEVYPYKPNDGCEMANQNPFQITNTDEIFEASLYANQYMHAEGIKPNACSGCVKCGACGITQELYDPKLYLV